MHRITNAKEVIYFVKADLLFNNSYFRWKGSKPKIFLSWVLFNTDFYNISGGWGRKSNKIMSMALWKYNYFVALLLITSLNKSTNIYSISIIGFRFGVNSKPLIVCLIGIFRCAYFLPCVLNILGFLADWDTCWLVKNSNLWTVILNFECVTWHAVKEIPSQHNMLRIGQEFWYYM